MNCVALGKMTQSHFNSLFFQPIFFFTLTTLSILRANVREKSLKIIELAAADKSPIASQRTHTRKTGSRLLPRRPRLFLWRHAGLPSNLASDRLERDGSIFFFFRSSFVWISFSIFSDGTVFAFGHSLCATRVVVVVVSRSSTLLYQTIFLYIRLSFI